MRILKWNGQPGNQELRAFIQAKLKLYEHTPDMRQLELKLRNFLFVYDNTQRGHHFSTALAGPNDLCMGPAFTMEPLMVLKRRDGANSYPIALRKEGNGWTGHPKLNVRGELWCVPATTIRNMDAFKRPIEYNINGKKVVKKMWQRLEIPIKHPYKMEGYQPDTKATFIVSRGARPDIVWAYLGTDEWYDIVDDRDFGKVAQFIPHEPVPKIDRYYWFTTTEYNTP